MELDAVAAQECQPARQEPYAAVYVLGPWLCHLCLSCRGSPEGSFGRTQFCLICDCAFKNRVPSFGPSMICQTADTSDSSGIAACKSASTRFCPWSALHDWPDGLNSSLCFFSILPQLIPSPSCSKCFSLLDCCFLEGQLQVAAWLAQDFGGSLFWPARNSRHVGLLPEFLLQRFSHRLEGILSNHTPASSNGNGCFAQMG